MIADKFLAPVVHDDMVKVTAILLSAKLKGFLELLLLLLLGIIRAAGNLLFGGGICLKNGRKGNRSKSC